MASGPGDLEFRIPRGLLSGVRQKQRAGEAREALVLKGLYDLLKHLLRGSRQMIPLLLNERKLVSSAENSWRIKRWGAERAEEGMYGERLTKYWWRRGRNMGWISGFPFFFSCKIFCKFLLEKCGSAVGSNSQHGNIRWKCKRQLRKELCQNSETPPWTCLWLLPSSGGGHLEFGHLDCLLHHPPCWNPLLHLCQAWWSRRLYCSERAELSLPYHIVASHLSLKSGQLLYAPHQRDGLWDMDESVAFLWLFCL